MRKCALVAAAAGLALSGSLVRADFVISSSRTDLGNGTDRVNFFLQNTNSGDTANTGGNLGSGDFALYAPPTAAVPNNGLFVSTNSAGTGHNLAVSPAAALTQIGFIDDTPSVMAPLSTGVLLLNGTSQQPPTTGGFNNGQQVAGLSQLFNGTGALLNVSTPQQFASVVVPHGGPVEVLPNVAGFAGITNGHDGNRTIFPNFDPQASYFTADNITNTTASNARTSAFVDGVVPEPASLGLIGIGLAGLVARRRRSM